MKILLVEDELRLAEALTQILQKQGYQVDMTGDGVEAQDYAETGLYDVIILDRMLPHKEGVEILKHIRKNGIMTPVIFLTAKDALPDRIEGLDAGADDYLVKPFSKDELLARVRALGRRSVNMLPKDRILVASLELDIKNCEASCLGTKIKLTATETQLLEFFMRNKGLVLGKEQIFGRVWGFEKEVEIACVELYVFYLRKKIDFSSCGVSLDTIRGVGYCLKEVINDT
ncbi:response regulator transcription factor [Ruminococcus sp. 5_1_39BFAA]|uniref:response regulator transcription factor n=1 Tax=Ruminococcus sp. 5_1_39BFAA TaxID=457412 RepID=UPI0035617DD9